MADIVYSDVEPGYGSRVRWGAVIAGVIIAMVTQVLLGLLGLAIGLTAFDPTRGAEGFGIGSGIWLILSTLIAVFVGAWVASWWANPQYRADGILHGVLTWSLFTLLTLFLLGSGIGSLIGGAFNMIAAGLTGVAQGAAIGYTAPPPAGAEQEAAAPPMNAQQIQERLTTLIGQTGPAGQRLAELDTSNRIKQQIAQRIAAGDDEGATNLITQNTDMSQAEARQLVQDAKVETREVAQQVTQTASRVAWWAFFAILLPLAAAALGGWLGLRTRYTGRRVV